MKVTVIQLISIKHAEFMAKYFNENNVPSIVYSDNLEHAARCLRARLPLT